VGNLCCDLSVACFADAKAIEISSLQSKDDMLLVLLHPAMIMRGDVAGILRTTGILTDATRLKLLVARVTDEVKTSLLLQNTCMVELQNNLREKVMAPLGSREVSMQSSIQQVKGHFVEKV
jgi:hypothetical protein